MSQFLGRVPTAHAPVVRSVGTFEGVKPSCEWFAGHSQRPATAHTWHPILGWVPVCGRCVDFTNDTKDGIK